MKKIQLLIVGVVVGTLFSCSPKNESNTTINIKGTSNVDFSIVTVDSCEYILYSAAYGKSICHKGNCKFCMKHK